MNAQEIINYIATAEKKTPVKLYVREKQPIDYGKAKVFGATDKIVFGDWKDLEPVLKANSDRIEDIVIENDCRNSAIPMLDKKNIKIDGVVKALGAYPLTLKLYAGVDCAMTLSVEEQK